MHQSVFGTCIQLVHISLRTPAHSYHTCGAMDSYTNTSIQDSVAGREFTVVVNSKPYAPYTYPKDYVQASVRYLYHMVMVVRTDVARI